MVQRYMRHSDKNPVSQVIILIRVEILYSLLNVGFTKVCLYDAKFKLRQHTDKTKVAGSLFLVNLYLFPNYY